MKLITLDQLKIFVKYQHQNSMFGKDSCINNNHIYQFLEEMRSLITGLVKMLINKLSPIFSLAAFSRKKCRGILITAALSCLCFDLRPS